MGATAGRIWIGAITALASVAGEPTVTGGDELEDVRGQHVRYRPGLRVELDKDDENYDAVFVSDKEAYPHILIPYSGDDSTVWDIILAPFLDASFKLRRLASEGLISLPKTSILVIPDDPDKDRYVYLPAAQIGPESSDLINMHEVDPLLIEDVEFIPGVPENGDDDFVVGTLAEVAAAVTAAQGGGGA